MKGKYGTHDAENEESEGAGGRAREAGIWANEVSVWCAPSRPQDQSCHSSGKGSSPGNLRRVGNRRERCRWSSNSSMSGARKTESEHSGGSLRSRHRWEIRQTRLAHPPLGCREHPASQNGRMNNETACPRRPHPQSERMWSSPRPAVSCNDEDERKREDEGDGGPRPGL